MNPSQVRRNDTNYLCGQLMRPNGKVYVVVVLLVKLNKTSLLPSVFKQSWVDNIPLTCLSLDHDIA